MKKNEMKKESWICQQLHMYQMCKCNSYIKVANLKKKSQTHYPHQLTYYPALS